MDPRFLRDALLQLTLSVQINKPCFSFYGQDTQCSHLLAVHSPNDKILPLPVHSRLFVLADQRILLADQMIVLQVLLLMHREKNRHRGRRDLSIGSSGLSEDHEDWLMMQRKVHDMDMGAGPMEGWGDGGPLFRGCG